MIEAFSGAYCHSLILYLQIHFMPMPLLHRIGRMNPHFNGKRNERDTLFLIWVNI